MKNKLGFGLTKLSIMIIISITYFRLTVSLYLTLYANMISMREISTDVHL